MAGKVYSYARFSTVDQAKGDSLRRQTADAEKYAAGIGAVLDTDLTMVDAGVSAYRGDNVDIGALGGFLELAKAGKIEPDSTLVVESLDRLSRKAARRATRILESIVDAGIAVHTTADGKTYTAESLDDDPMSFMWAFMVAIRAHEESATKSRRGRAAWRNKRERIAEGHVLTRRVPAWLRVVDDRFEPIPERVAFVRTLFDDVARGVSLSSIARRLNESDVPTWGPVRKGNRPQWYRSYLVKIIRNRAVLGEYQPHHRVGRGREPTGDVIPNYFPAVITQDEWNAAHDVLGRGVPRVGKSAGRPELANVLAGIARCASCGGTVGLRNAGRKLNWRYLACRDGRYKNGACHGKNRSVRLDRIEEKLIEYAPLMPEEGAADPGLLRQVEEARHGLWAIQEQVEEITAAIARRKGGSKALERALVNLEEQEEAAWIEFDVLQEQAAAASGAVVTHRLEGLRDALLAQPLDREAANVALRAAVDRVVMDYEGGYLILHWRHGRISPLEVDLRGGGVREFTAIDPVPLFNRDGGLTIREFATEFGVELGEARNWVRRLVAQGKVRRLDRAIKGREGKYGVVEGSG